MSVGHLLEEFESLLSPVRLAACTPDQRQGAAAHTAWEELQATLKRCAGVNHNRAMANKCVKCVLHGRKL